MRRDHLSSASPMRPAAGGGTIRPMQRFLTRRRTQGAFLMLIAAAVAIILALFASRPHGSSVARVVTVVLVIIQAGSLGLMRPHPERAMMVSLAAGVGLQALWPDLRVLGLANLSLCAFAALRPPRVTLWALGFMLALVPWPAATRGALAGLIAAGGPVLSWSWGELLRTRHERRRGETRRAAAQERARIARELHDVVAHNVSLIVVQAVAARRLAHDNPRRHHVHHTHHPRPARAPRDRSLAARPVALHACLPRTHVLGPADRRWPLRPVRRSPRGRRARPAFHAADDRRRQPRHRQRRRDKHLRSADFFDCNRRCSARAAPRSVGPRRLVAAERADVCGPQLPGSRTT